MLISILIHSMNRAYDLKESMPYVIESANQSPPVEILVLNYSSTDDLDEYMSQEIMKETMGGYLKKGNFFTYISAMGRKFYSSPEARNIAQIESKGKYGIQWACDSYCKPEFIKVIRDLIEKENPVWLCEGWMGRAVTCRKDEFINSGGYDLRFNYYAPEDKDICQRLHRRGGKFVQFPSDLIWDTPTSWKTKLANIQKEGSHMAQLREMNLIYQENCEKGVLVANERLD